MRQRGQSLIEVLVALSILATGYLAYIQLNSRILKSELLTQQMLEASLLCANKLEELKTDFSLSRLDSGTQRIERTTTNYSLIWSTRLEQDIYILETQITWESTQGSQQFTASTQLSPYQFTRYILGNSAPIVKLP